MTAASEHRVALRGRMRERRLTLPARRQVAAAEALAERLRALPELAGNGYVAGYWAVRGEISLHALLAPPPGFVYCLPCLAAGSTLRFAPWRFGDSLVANRYGIPEPDYSPDAQLAPSDLAAVLVPLVAFHPSGTRLGTGGGYYDRSFAFLRDLPRPARPLMIGVGHDFQQDDALEPEPWDVPLDFIVTDARTLRCG
jgi:5-formyltetrahydrofolate cyclo-ligase